MPISNPQYQFMDFGRSYGAGQTIAHNRMVNQAAGLDLQDRQNMLTNRKKAQEIRTMFEGMPAQIEQMEAQGLHNEADKLRESYIKTMFNSVNLIKGMRGGIDADNYQSVRSDFMKAGAFPGEMWPVNYSDKWFRDQEKKAKGNLQKLTLKWSQAGKTMSRDIVAQDGKVQWQGKPYQAGTDKPKAADPFEYKPSDDNAIGQQAVRFYGGTYNPTTGKFTGLSREVTAEVAAVHAEAAKLYNKKRSAGEAFTHAEAFREAANKLGATIKDPQDTLSFDPAGIGAKQPIPGQ